VVFRAETPQGSPHGGPCLVLSPNTFLWLHLRKSIDSRILKVFDESIPWGYQLTATTDTTSQLLNRLRMRQIALLLAIGEHRTLHAASQQMGMTQPAATKMLHELEDALGQRLFDRVGRGLTLNAAGLAVMNTFRGMRGTMEALNRELQELRLGGAGKLFIGCIMAASPGLLTDTLIRLREEYPLLSIEIAVETSDRLVEQLREGALDVVIGRMLGPATQNHMFRPLGEEPLSVVVATDHPLAERSSVTFDDMLQYPWILQPHGSPMREVLEQEFRDHHTSFHRGLIETSSILTTTNLIFKTQMIAVIPESSASRYQTHGLLKILPYTIAHKLAAYGSIVRSDRPVSAAAARFLELLHS
jgi:DNA-binding transcriptional LysR family regulator